MRRYVCSGILQQEPSHSVNITDNSCIDSTLTEKWLGDHAQALGLNPTEDTVYFINWWGRPDFHFHTYVNWEHPDVDADTGTDNAQYQYYEMQAWGGTTPDDEQNGLGSLRRIWFYDLSAGPDGNSLNFILNTADVNGDGVPDYRIPPIWEYGNLSAYRPFDDLSGDLSVVLRYIGLDAMITAAPFFNPEMAARLPNSIQTDITYFNGDGDADGRDLSHPDRAKLEWSKVKPFNVLSNSEKTIPYNAEHDAIYQCSLPYWSGVFTNCYPGRSNGDWDMNIYHSDHINDYLSGHPDHQVQHLVYTLPDADAVLNGLLGVAFTAGQFPGFTYNWNLTSNREWMGVTLTMIHEVGHHFGYNHPHDVYDYTDNWFYYASQDLILRMADESDSVMGYMDLSNNFSQFDRDNMDRWMTAIYINKSNELLPGILASDPNQILKLKLAASDVEATLAVAAYKNMQYRIAAGLAKNAYDRIQKIADENGVTPSPIAARRADLGLSASKKNLTPIVEDERFNSFKMISDPLGELRKNPSVVNTKARQANGFLKRAVEKPNQTKSR